MERLRRGLTPQVISFFLNQKHDHNAASFAARRLKALGASSMSIVDRIF